MCLNYSFAKTVNTAVVIERQGSGRTNLTDVMKVSIDKIERLHKAHPDWSASRPEGVIEIIKTELNDVRTKFGDARC